MTEIPSRVVRAGVVQMQMDELPQRNIDAAIEGIRAAAAEGARLICLPELFRSRYFCQTEDPGLFALAESIPGPSTQLFAALAEELDVVIIASLFERRAAGIYHNTAVVLDGAKGLLGCYRKMHIPDDPRYYEKFYFTPGDLGFRSFQTSVGAIGVLICWDQWYPEAARLTALSGAEILIYPTAIGWHPDEKADVGVQQHSAWETIQRGHAIANGCYVVSANRAGFEPDPSVPSGDEGIEFWGQSFVAGPSGEMLAKAPHSGGSLITADLDLERVEQTRISWPFLRDRRIDAYGDIVKRYIDLES